MDPLVRLRKKTVRDATNDYNWKMDPELCSLDATQLLIITYAQFLASYPLEQQYTYAIETLDGEHIGNCGFYNVEGNTAMIGIIIGDKRFWDKGYGAAAVGALLELEPEFHNITLRTLVWNTRAMKCFEKCGFRFTHYATEEGHMFVFMELVR